MWNANPRGCAQPAHHKCRLVTEIPASKVLGKSRPTPTEREFACEINLVAKH
jgi:hypothetical protein